MLRMSHIFGHKNTHILCDTKKIFEKNFDFNVTQFLTLFCVIFALSITPLSSRETFKYIDFMGFVTPCNPL